MQDDTGRSATETETLLTVPDVARILRIGRSMAYNLVNRPDGPPTVRLGTAIRIRRADLDRWLRDRAGSS